MSDMVEGVAAVLHTRMADNAVQFGEPSPFLLVSGTEIHFRRRRAGEVTAMWQEGGQVWWRGRLDLPLWPEPATGGDPLRVPCPGVDVRGLVAAGRLVGMPAVLQSRAESRDGCMMVADWTVHRMDLLGTEVAPWPGMELRLEEVGSGPAGMRANGGPDE